MEDLSEAVNGPFKHVDASKNSECINLKPLRIARLNTEYILTKRTTLTVRDKTDFHSAHSIIDEILKRKKRKRADGNTNPCLKRQKLDKQGLSNDLYNGNTYISHEYKQDFEKLQIDPEIQRSLHRSGVTFKFRLYVTEKMTISQMTECLSRLLKDQERQNLLQKKDAQKSFVLFFYRNIENNTKNNSFIPEIFVLTSGSAWTILSNLEKTNVDTNFSNRIERRTLCFKFESVKSEKESGNTMKESLMARSGHKIEFSVWDFMDKLVQSRIREIREDSSLYSDFLRNAFLTKEGNKIPAKFEISTTSVKIKKDLNLLQLGLILDHFSNICLKKPTYLVKDTKQTDENESEEREEEVDDEQFEMHDYIAEVSDEKIIHRLDAALHDTLEESMKGNKSYIYLTHRSLSQWQVASEITLAARKTTDTQERATRTNRRCLNKESPWTSPPSLEAVMELLRNAFNGEYHKGWLDNEDALIKFKNGQGEPLRNFLFTRIEVEFAGAYMCYYGTWMEMSAHYLYTIEKDFVRLLAKTILKRNELPWLLPWKNPSETCNKGNKKYFDWTGNGKREKCTEYDIEKSKPLWQNHFKNACCRNEPFNQICIEAEKLRQGKVFISNYDTLKEKSLEEKAGHLYHHLECSLNEHEYNKVHSLFNRICQNYNHRMRIIVCDNIEPHNIELCDILMFNEDTTYLVHVKKEFQLKSIRVVCSQIHNAADQIYHDQSCGTDLIKRYWEELTQSNRLESMSVRQFQDLFKLNRKIVFVLACRDTRQECDFIDDVRNRDNLQVKMTDSIRNEFKAEYGETVIARLKEKRYLSKKGELTNQFILDGKSKEGKAKFVNVMLSSKCVKDENDAKKLHAVLVAGLSRSLSTGAKMEIIRLAHYFKAIGRTNFKLRIYSICHDFESIDDKISDNPAVRVIDDSSDDKEEVDDEPGENVLFSSQEKSCKSDNAGNTSKRSNKSSSHKDKGKRLSSNVGKEGKAEKKISKGMSLEQRRRHIQKTQREAGLRSKRVASKDRRTLESKFPKKPPKVQQQPQMSYKEQMEIAEQNNKEKLPEPAFRPPRMTEERPRTQEEINRRRRADAFKRRKKGEEIIERRKQSADRQTLLGSVSTSPQKEASQSTHGTSDLKIRNTPKPDGEERITNEDGMTHETKYNKHSPNDEKQPLGSFAGLMKEIERRIKEGERELRRTEERRRDEEMM